MKNIIKSFLIGLVAISAFLFVAYLVGGYMNTIVPAKSDDVGTLFAIGILWIIMFIAILFLIHSVGKIILILYKKAEEQSNKK